jgi:signal transduction histidine kinase
MVGISLLALALWKAGGSAVTLATSASLILSVAAGAAILGAMVYGKRTQELDDKARAERKQWMSLEVSSRHHAEVAAYERSCELNALLRAAHDIDGARDLYPQLESVTQHMSEVLPYDAIEIVELLPDNSWTSLFIRGPEQFIHACRAQATAYASERDLHYREIVRTREPLLINDVNSDAPGAWAVRQRITPTGAWTALRGCVIAPLLVRGSVIGYMLIANNKVNAYSPKRATLAGAFADLVANAIEKTRAHEATLLAATLTEKNRFARELHDLVSQSLFGVLLGVRTIAHATATASPPDQNTIKYVVDSAESALADLRALVFELRPDYLEREGLHAALRKQIRALCERHRIALKLELCDPEPRLPLATQEALYGVALEAVQNAATHGRPTSIILRATHSQQVYEISVQDNGAGFDAARIDASHRGMRSMHERARGCGAYLSVASAPGKGATVALSVSTRQPASGASG